MIESMLDVLGLRFEEQTVYEALVRMPGASVDDLAVASRLTRPQVRTALDVLVALGLVGRSHGATDTYVAAPPEVALEVLILEREAQLNQARTTMQRLHESYQRTLSRQHPVGLVEIVAGREATVMRGEQIQRGCREELLVLQRPPYIVDPAQPNNAELDTLAKGVTHRVVYDRTALEIEGWWADHYLPAIAAGEQARVMTGVPVKLAIADGRIGYVPLLAEDGRIENCAVVHASELLDGLRALFEATWQRALPLTRPDQAGPEGRSAGTDGGGGPTAFEGQLLGLLTAGLGDRAISRQTGMSYRTLQRRVHDLMERLGAQTRFQAGLQAAFLGWVKPPDTHQPSERDG